jgi:hypothetical protein
MQPNIPSIPFCEPCGALMSASCRELAELRYANWRCAAGAPEG